MKLAAEAIPIQKNPVILAVDDEPYNLEIMQELLEDEGYAVDLAESGGEALHLLQNNPLRYSTVLLDRMMPGLDGLEVLKFMKKQPELRFIPVIVQTAKATRGDIQEGLDNGVIYYLTKPFERQHLANIVNTSVTSFAVHQELSNSLCQYQRAPLEQREMEFSSLVDARSIAILFASLCPDPHRVIPGLNELLINAVEHGNLNIGYKRKSLLLEMGKWLEEIEERLRLPEYVKRKARIVFQETEDEIRFSIRDEGAGFDVEKYLEIDPDRAVNTHGRGIVVARAVSFDRLEFVPPNNVVVATILKNDKV